MYQVSNNLFLSAISDPTVKVKMVGKYGPLIGAIDQGTSSSRFLVFWVMDLNSNPYSKLYLLGFLSAKSRAHHLPPSRS